MRVFVFEHVCGGGMTRRLPDPGVTRQAAAVLSAVVESFTRAGIMVLTTLDHRLSLDLGPAQVLTVGPDDSVEAVIDQLAAEADWALVIAPEFDSILESWSLKLTASGARRLGSRPEAIALCADKIAFSRALRNRKIPTPPTARLEPQQTVDQSLVIKRRHGAACQDLYVARNRSELAAVPFGRDWIVQPLVPGTPLACSFFVHGSKRTALPIVQQIVDVDATIRLRGLRFPVPSALAERAAALAAQALDAVPGLRGFVGVDVIAATDPAQDVVLEINPRPTLAYVALHRACLTHLARAFTDPDAPLRWSKDPFEFVLSAQPVPLTTPVP